MKSISTSTPLRFMMAIVAAFTISFSIASMASMTGLLPQAKVDPQSPSFIAPLASQMHEAVMLAAASAAVQYAPAAQQDALTPHGAAASAAP